MADQTAATHPHRPKMDGSSGLDLFELFSDRCFKA